MKRDLDLIQEILLHIESGQESLAMKNPCGLPHFDPVAFEMRERICFGGFFALPRHGGETILTLLRRVYRTSGRISLI